MRSVLRRLMGSIARGLSNAAGWAFRVSTQANAVPSELPRRARQRSDTVRTFTVLRWQKKRYWTLYEGPDGAEARRRYEAVEKAGESGRMEFQMTDPAAPGGYVVRAVYGELDEWVDRH